MAEVQLKDLTSYTDFLPQQYNDSEKIKTFLTIFLEQVQELEQANIDLDSFSTDIDLAFGYQLDIIGKLIGVARNGLTDEQYRDAIYFQISINVGTGTPEDCIQYLSSVTQASNINYWEHYPASIILETNGTNIPENLVGNVDNVALAGVSIGGVIISESGEVFRGCDIDTAFDNYNADTGLFEDVSDESDIARCIFPEYDEVYTALDVGAGEPTMEAGEPLAESGDSFSNPLTTKGIFAEIYT